MTIDIDELERLAKEATPGPWFAERRPELRTWSVRSEPAGERVLTIEPWGEEQDLADASFIAAANPQAVIELVGKLRRADEQCEIWMRKRDRAFEERDAAGERVEQLEQLLAANVNELAAERSMRERLQDEARRIPAASDLAIALRELRERRNSYAARHARMVASQAAPEVIASYEKTLAEVDAAIAAVERLRGVK